MKPYTAKPTCYDRLQVTLKDVIAEQSFNQWLNSKCKLLDNKKPLDLIIDGKCEDVMAAANEIARRGYR